MPISLPTGASLPSPGALAGLLFLVFAPLHFILPQTASIALSGVTLALIGGAYIGFAANAREARVFWLEMMTAMGFGLVAVLGIWVHWIFLPLGLALHAGWDILHHRPGFGAPVPKWYIPFCVIFDLMAAGFLLLLYGVVPLFS